MTQRSEAGGQPPRKALEINKEAAKYFYYQLRTERGSVGMEYLRKRELSDETMNHFGLGMRTNTATT